MIRKKITVLLLAVLMASACTTMTEKGAEKKALKLTAQLNKGEVDKLLKESLKPLLFDTELLYTEKLIHALWSGLIQSGYRLENPVIISLAESGPDSYKIFADTWEAETFYKKYAPENCFLVTVQGDNNHQMVLLLNRNTGDYYSIVAYKVVK